MTFSEKKIKYHDLSKHIFNNYDLIAVFHFLPTNTILHQDLLNIINNTNSDNIKLTFLPNNLLKLVLKTSCVEYKNLNVLLKGSFLYCYTNNTKLLLESLNNYKLLEKKNKLLHSHFDLIGFILYKKFYSISEVSTCYNTVCTNKNFKLQRKLLFSLVEKNPVFFLKTNISTFNTFLTTIKSSKINNLLNFIKKNKLNINNKL